MADLETRLRAINPDVNGAFVAEASKQRINPRERYREMPYLKENLVAGIRINLNRQGMNFTHDSEERLYGSVLNKEPLKRVYYGMLTAPNMPSEVLQALDGAFEPCYLYAGVWDRAMVSSEKPIYLNVALTLERGLDNLYKNHYLRNGKGKLYDRDIVLPGGKEIREVLKKFSQEHYAAQSAAISSTHAVKTLQPARPAESQLTLF